MKLDFRIKILGSLLLIGVVALVIVITWWFFATSARLQFGDPDQWPTHTTEINNITFRYPPNMEVIVPTNEKENPVSLVKKEEGGESVLIQVGTWRLETNPPQGINEVISRYEGRFPTARPVISKERIIVDGREGIVYLQREGNSDRLIGEAFFWDLDEPREISLQIPDRTQGNERELWKNTYLEIVRSLKFLIPLSESDSDSRPEGVPAIFRYFEDQDAAFSMWFPPNWIQSDLPLSESDSDSPWMQGPQGARTVAFHPKNDSATIYIVHALPQDALVTLDALNDVFGKPFRKSAVEGSLAEEQVGLPYVGAARSLEARQPFGENQILTYLLLLVVTPTLDENGLPINYEEAGRGYVIVNLLPDGKAQGAYREDVREMTRTFRIIK